MTVRGQKHKEIQTEHYKKWEISAEQAGEVSHFFALNSESSSRTGFMLCMKSCADI